MKTRNLFAIIALVLIAGVHQVLGQLPVISSFGQNGVLVCSNLQPGTAACVEWASSLAGPWQTNWDALSAMIADSNGTISVGVPMFYRVRGAARTNTADGMALIPAGTFTMGDTLNDGQSDAIAANISVSAFYMDTNLVSYSQWQAVYAYATNHGYSFGFSISGKAANHPVQQVDWYDCVKWCNARSQQANLAPVYYADSNLTQVFITGDGTNAVYANWTAKGYRLPTEAEWEKAARGGASGQRFPSGNTISESQANYFSSSFQPPAYDLGPNDGYNDTFNTGVGTQPYTSPVGSFAANGYGLNDMAGNVLEWCWDYYGTPYGQPTNTNPTGTATPETGGYRVLRGGSWETSPYNLRCAARISFSPSDTVYDIGFRCVRIP